MLADTILAERGGTMDRLTGGSVTALAQVIRRAARFDLTPGVVVSGYAVRQTSLVSQLRALSLCRLPFITTWFEWPGSDPAYEPYRENSVTPLTPAPVRVGAGRDRREPAAWGGDLRVVAPDCRPQHLPFGGDLRLAGEPRGG
jgi:hypothetical protein